MTNGTHKIDIESEEKKIFKNIWKALTSVFTKVKIGPCIDTWEPNNNSRVSSKKD